MLHGDGEAVGRAREARGEVEERSLERRFQGERRERPRETGRDERVPAVSRAVQTLLISPTSPLPSRRGHKYQSRRTPRRPPSLPRRRPVDPDGEGGSFSRYLPTPVSC